MAGHRGKPPGVSDGRPVWSRGRQVIAGLAPFEQSFSPRAHPNDLWAGLDATSSEIQARIASKRLGGRNFSASDSRRYRAFLKQAREFYIAQLSVTPAAKPLPAYYFLLNLTKAFLTLADPQLMRSDYMQHGLSIKPGKNHTYAIDDALSDAKPTGVFPELAGRTGAGNKKPVGNPVVLAELLAYLTEATDEYSAMSGSLAPLLPIRSIDVLQHDGSAFLSVAVSTEALKRRKGLSPAKLPSEAALFGNNFRFAGNDPESGNSFYESTPVKGPGRAETWSELARMLDRSLVGVDRSKLGGQWYVTLDTRKGLISYEAVTFLTMHHLSEIVRYRPHAAEELLESKYAWVLNTWVNRASDNFLLTMASRITDRDHRIRS